MSSKIQFSKYLIIVLGMPLLFLSIFAVFNRIVDPVGLFYNPLINTVTFNRPYAGHNLRLHKAFMVQHQKPSTIILASSRGNALDSEHSGWKGNEPYNLSLYGSTIYELYRYMQHAHSFNPLKKVVLMLDFSMFNANIPPNQDDFNEEYLAVKYSGVRQNMTSKYALLFSKDMLVKSIYSVLTQHVDNTPLSNGMPRNIVNPIDILDRRTSFISQEKNYYKNHYNNYVFSGMHNNWDIYSKILNFSYQNNIELSIVIPPMHARLLETISEKGLWGIFEEWKKKLVSIDENEAVKSNSDNYPVWDFAVYSAHTTENIHVSEQTNHSTAWFSDSTHFSIGLGDLILDKILDNKKTEQSNQSDFGFKITSKNIGYHLSDIRKNREAWIISHPKDVSDIIQIKYD